MLWRVGAGRRRGAAVDTPQGRGFNSLAQLTLTSLQSGTGLYFTHGMTSPANTRLHGSFEAQWCGGGSLQTARQSSLHAVAGGGAHQAEHGDRRALAQRRQQQRHQHLLRLGVAGDAALRWLPYMRVAVG